MGDIWLLRLAVLGLASVVSLCVVGLVILAMAGCDNPVVYMGLLSIGGPCSGALVGILSPNRGG